MSAENSSMNMDEKLIELLARVEVLAKLCEINRSMDDEEIDNIIEGLKDFNENLVYDLKHRLLSLRALIDKNKVEEEEGEEDDSCESVPGWAATLIGDLVQVAKVAGITYLTTMTTIIAEEYGKRHGRSFIDYVDSKISEHKSSKETQTNLNALKEAGQKCIENTYRKCK